jgi:antitoxin HicB
MENFIYPAKIKPDKRDGGFVVTFPDLPEAITQGEELRDAIVEAADCLEESIANRIIMELSIPHPSPVRKMHHPISLSTQIAAKAALYMAIVEEKITKVELAKRLHCDEKEVRRLLNPRHPSKLPRIESALAVLGRKLVIGFQAVA